MLFLPTKKNNISENVVKQIIAAIQSNKLKPGDKLPGEIKLSHDFQISRNSIREAIKALSWFGVIDSKHGKGTYVAEDAIEKITNLELFRLISKDPDLVELTEVRMILESKMAFLAAKRAKPEDIKELQKILEKQEQIVLKNDLDEVRKDLKQMSPFHEKIALMAGNKVALNMLKAISYKIAASREKYYLVDDPQERHKRLNWNLSEHKAIFECIAGENSEKARALMDRHLLSMLEQIALEE